MIHQIQDQTLWQLYRAGDKHALGLLAERYYRTLRHYGLKFMIDGAVVEDCIQDLFLQLWQNRLQINETDSVKHYLLKALRHHILQHLRSVNKVVHETLDWNAPFHGEINAEELMIQEESLSSLTEMMQTQLAILPSREREALYLRYYENLSIPQIARDHECESAVGF